MSDSIRNRVVVVGCGAVGATFAYTLLLGGTADEVVLIDQRRDKARGDALDLNHGLPFTRPVRVWDGDYPDCAGAALVVIAAGVNQVPGETRTDLLQRNVAVLRQVLLQVLRYTQDAILVIATNPVDVLAYAAWKLSGLTADRVIGSGTLLDTARFRYLIGQHLGVDPKSVHASIIGEHGDTELPVWSLANVAGVSLAQFPGRRSLTPDDQERIFAQTRDAAYEIIAAKGATYYAIALALDRLVRSVLRDERSVLTVSTLVQGQYGIADVYLGLPAVVGRQGIEEVISLPLTPAEEERLHHSAAYLTSLNRVLDLTPLPISAGHSR